MDKQIKEIYISEKNMPKSCDYCDYGKNCIPYKIEKVEEKDKTFSILETYNCPLQSLEQHDKEVRKEFAERIKANFISSAKNQDFISVKNVLENVCTAKVDNLLKKYNGELK